MTWINTLIDDYFKMNLCSIRLELIAMLTFEDCLALCKLSAEEVSAIAEHEHLPEMTALEYGEYLIDLPDGEKCIKDMIIDDINHARACGNNKHAGTLEAVLKHFVMTHPKLQPLLDSKTH